MTYGNIIKNIHFIGHGWDFDLTIRAADEQGYNEAKTYIRDVLAGGSERARQEFLTTLRDRQGHDH